MRIRKRILLSYGILVLIMAVYFLFLLILGKVQKRRETDTAELYRSKEIWNELQISLNELQINWSDGLTYQKFTAQHRLLEEHLQKMLEGNPSLIERKQDLYASWSMARESILEIIQIIESLDFQRVIDSLEKAPGLQRFTSLWTEWYYGSPPFRKKEAYVLRAVMDGIEFFPIYSETINNLFDVIIKENHHITRSLKMTRILFSVGFHGIFLVLYFFSALRFSRSLSQPIKELSLELSAFMGKALKRESYSHADEMELLTHSVKNLIRHYTFLAELAQHLAQGKINSPLLDLQEQGVVGKALKEINLYLQELAATSQWIRDGHYGAKIRVRSEEDVLAVNFNIMSQVINEKISTLQNMFETVEESIVVTDCQGNILETNHKFLELTGQDSSPKTESGAAKLADFFVEDMPWKEIFAGGGRKIFSGNIADSQSHVLPVKIVSRMMREVPNQRNKVMLFLSNESLRVRMEREKESLRAYAVEAELRALRAQINPHFLFNTLNGIAHLVESGGHGAVSMIEKLAELFRYSLTSTKRRTVSLFEEINVIKQFMDIEKMRFGERPQVKYQVDSSLLHTPIPPMLLQPLVENALQHGAGENGEIYVEISIKKEEGYLVLTVGDRGCQTVDYKGLPGKKGMGMRNVNQRLKSLYNEELRFAPNRPQGLRVIMRIPGAAHA